MLRACWKWHHYPWISQAPCPAPGSTMLVITSLKAPLGSSFSDVPWLWWLWRSWGSMVRYTAGHPLLESEVFQFVGAGEGNHKRGIPSCHGMIVTLVPWLRSCVPTFSSVSERKPLCTTHTEVLQRDSFPLPLSWWPPKCSRILFVDVCLPSQWWVQPHLIHKTD